MLEKERKPTMMKVRLSEVLWNCAAAAQLKTSIIPNNVKCTTVTGCVLLRESFADLVMQLGQLSSLFFLGSK